MSREIKFRSWDGDVMYGPTTLKALLSTLDVRTGWKYSEKNIWMQYTGLKDKNEKEIYEGDICKVWGHPQLHQDFEYTAVVIWQEYSAGFKFEKILPTKVMWDMGHNTCEIIGNIYENPELL